MDSSDWLEESAHIYCRANINTLIDALANSVDLQRIPQVVGYILNEVGIFSDTVHKNTVIHILKQLQVCCEGDQEHEVYGFVIGTLEEMFKGQPVEPRTITLSVK